MSVLTGLYAITGSISQYHENDYQQATSQLVEQVEAAFEQGAMHRVDDFLVAPGISLGLPRQEQGLQIGAQAVRALHDMPGDGHREKRFDLHGYGRMVIGVLSDTDSQISIIAALLTAMQPSVQSLLRYSRTGRSA